MGNESKSRSIKNKAVNLRVDADFKNRLRQAADRERRSVTNMVMKILSDWLENEAKVKQ